MAEAVEACRFTPHCKTEPDTPPPPSMPTDVVKGSKPSGSVFTDRRVSFESMETEKPVGSDTATLEPVAEKLDQNYLEFQGAAMPMVDLASPERMLKNTDKTDTEVGIGLTDYMGPEEIAATQGFDDPGTP